MAYNVLIADDSETTRRIIAKALRHTGVELGEVYQAGNGVEAYEILSREWLDIVIADLNMPEMGGLELVAHMAQIDLLSTIPVIIVSTEGREDRIKGLLEAGVAAYVRKPFSPEQLSQTVSGLLAERGVAIEASVLCEAFFDALEGFAMLVAEPVANTPEPPDHAVLARMRFASERASGSTMIAVPEDGCGIIASMATGEEGGADGCDALRELLNVVCGHLVDSLAGGPFGIEPPQSCRMPGVEAWIAVTGAATFVAFDIEGVPALVGVELDPDE